MAITRRKFIQDAGLGAICLSGLASSPSWGLEGDPLPAPPNILILQCDQLNADVLGCYGGPVPTPNIDRIAAEGALFTNATCPTPLCSPSRASLIMGRFPHAHGIVTNLGDGQEGLHATDVTTESLLSAAGYETTHSGKWHLGSDPLPYYVNPYRLGNYMQEMDPTFQETLLLPADQRMTLAQETYPVKRSSVLIDAVSKLAGKWDTSNNAELMEKMGRLQFPPEQTFDARFADATIAKLLVPTTNPRMLTCSFVWPHPPTLAPAPYYDLFDPRTIRLPNNINTREAIFEKNWSRKAVADLNEGALREYLRIYHAMVKLVDDQVGRILRTLETTGALQNTVILFTADHGDMAGGHGMIGKTTPAFYEEIVRVPLLVRYPARIPPQRSDISACLTDVMPTLLDLAGQPIPATVQGHSLVPYLTGAVSPDLSPQYTFSERVADNALQNRDVLPGTMGSFMVRGTGWKYILYSTGGEYLYNLVTDPGETTNLAAAPEYLATKERMRGELDAWVLRTGYPQAV